MSLPITSQTQSQTVVARVEEQQPVVEPAAIDLRLLAHLHLTNRQLRALDLTNRDLRVFHPNDEAVPMKIGG